ncbi:MAG: hypothetical protein Q4G35_08320 [Propionibacteriaceae bacterium]|nr:hypothetical protein [Propionibacteriaceae bacterium]
MNETTTPLRNIEDADWRGHELQTLTPPATIMWDVHGLRVRLTNEGVHLDIISDTLVTLHPWQVMVLLETLHTALESSQIGASPAPRSLTDAEEYASQEDEFRHRALRAMNEALGGKR